MVLEFIGGLWLGKTIDRKNEKFLIDKGISILINCSNDLSFLNNKNEYNEVIQKNIKKYEDIRLSEYLYKITDFIFNNLQKSNNILIYCENNEEYHFLIILSYLLRYANINFEKSVQIIRTKFLNAFSENFIYKNALIRLMKKI